ncbi:hypothetical protein GCM10010965_27490 [Caldalkalibacillus thermarum]|nr:hypothetical protein GCM10010965_27490 [Caldalkalibacillus thermarum]
MVLSNEAVAILDKKPKYVTTLPIRALKLADYQRKLSYSKAKKIAENFDPVGVGLIQVSKRDGQYYIIDGQHRFTAMKMLGMKNVECLVFEGMTYEEESKAFVYFNTIKNANRIDRANALLEADDPKMVMIKNVVERNGLQLDFKNVGRGIKAFTAIEKIYDAGGEEHLEYVLKLLVDSFGYDRKVYANYVLLGFHEFQTKYQKQYKRKMLVKRLQHVGFTALELKAKEFRQVHGGSLPKNVRMAIVYFYNKNRKEEHQLSM